MGKDLSDNSNNVVRVELKYCEHCGGLWVRERGAGIVYCEKCQGKVDELPMAKKRPGRIKLPAWQRAEGREYSGVVFEEDELDIDGVGGVAWAR